MKAKETQKGVSSKVREVSVECPSDLCQTTTDGANQPRGGKQNNTKMHMKVKETPRGVAGEVREDSLETSHSVCRSPKDR